LGILGLLLLNGTLAGPSFPDSAASGTILPNSPDLRRGELVEFASEECHGTVVTQSADHKYVLEVRMVSLPDVKTTLLFDDTKLKLGEVSRSAGFDGTLNLSPGLATITGRGEASWTFVMTGGSAEPVRVTISAGEKIALDRVVRFTGGQ
jgi:hypothetical protein